MDEGHSLLAMLLHHLRNSDDSDEDTIDDSDEEPTAAAGAAAATASGQAEALKASDFATSINIQTGNVPLPRLARCSNCNIQAALHKRRINRNRRGQFTAGERAGLMKRYLPSTTSTTVEVFDSHVFCGTFSADGNMFMSACQDCVIRLYDTSGRNFKLKRSIQARDVGWAVVDTAYSPDKRFVAYSSWSHYIHLVTLDGDRHEALDLRPDSYHLCPFSIAFSYSGEEIIAGTNLDSVFIYDVFDDRRTMQIQAHADDVNAVAFADENRNIFFSGSDDSLCKVWDRRALRETNPQPVGTLLGHAHGITFIDSKGDGRHLITQSKDHSIKLWDIRKMAPASTQPPHQPHIDYRFAHGRNMARTRTVPGDCSLMTYRGHWVMQTLIRARFSPLESTGQKYIYSGSANGSVFIYDALSGEIVRVLEGHDQTVRDVSWHPTKPYLISSSWDGSVTKWNYEHENLVGGRQCGTVAHRNDSSEDEDGGGEYYDVRSMDEDEDEA